MRIDAPKGSGPCVKQTVRATIVAVDGERYVATNYTLNPQTECPRAGMQTGQGYELCRSVCQQPGHAEVNALRIAGDHARGGSLYIEGHTYACDSCLKAAQDAGIVAVHIGPPPRRIAR